MTHSPRFTVYNLVQITKIRFPPPLSKIRVHTLLPSVKDIEYSALRTQHLHKAPALLVARQPRVKN